MNTKTSPEVTALFEEFVARHLRGDVPDPIEYGYRAGDGAPELDRLVAAFLASAPPVEPTAEAIARLREEGKRRATSQVADVIPLRRDGGDVPVVVKLEDDLAVAASGAPPAVGQAARHERRLRVTAPGDPDRRARIAVHLGSQQLNVRQLDGTPLELVGGVALGRGYRPVPVAPAVGESELAVRHGLDLEAALSGILRWP